MIDAGKDTNPKDALSDNKVPVGLFPATAIAAGSMAFLEGFCKYGGSNWRATGVRASVYVNACSRHMTAWNEGQDTDPDSGLCHLYKALACIAILIDAQAAGRLNDDRPLSGGYAAMMAELQALVPAIKAMHADKSPRHYTIADNAEYCL